ncbi:hypothetical protein FSST1_009843 [Fusarium sambucinum]
MHPSYRSVKPRSLSSSPDSTSSEGPRKANRACEKCTRTKKKCDKASPSCSRCRRLRNKCCYDYIFTPSVTAVISPESLANSPPGSGLMQDTFTPFLDISSSMILSLLSPNHSVQHYLETINPYLTIVHPELWAIRTNNFGFDSIADQELQNPATALLAVCMQLLSRNDDSVESMSIKEEGIDMPTYRAAKQILSILRTLDTPSIELIQCSLLLAFYEYSHEDLARAYVSIGDANTMASILQVGPGKYLEVEQESYIPYEEEERRCVYWSLFVLDCLIQTDYSFTHMSDQIPCPVVSPPTADDLLPTNQLPWYDEEQSTCYVTQRYPADTAFSVPVGIFQRNCQYAMLYARTSHPGRSAYKFACSTTTPLSSKRYHSPMKWSISSPPLLSENFISEEEPDWFGCLSPFGDDTSLLSFQKDIDDLILQNDEKLEKHILHSRESTVQFSVSL